MTRVALDSNILIYLAGVMRVADDAPKIGAVRSLVDRLWHCATVVAPVQSLGELFIVLRRTGASLEEARMLVLDARDQFEVAAVDTMVVAAALDLAAAHRLQYWDAVIVSAAVAAGCTMLLSEDMQHGFTLGRLVIVNPLAEPMHPKLAATLATG